MNVKIEKVRVNNERIIATPVWPCGNHKAIEFDDWKACQSYFGFSTQDEIILQINNGKPCQGYFLDWSLFKADGKVDYAVLAQCEEQANKVFAKTGFISNPETQAFLFGKKACLLEMKKMQSEFREMQQRLKADKSKKGAKHGI